MVHYMHVSLHWKTFYLASFAGLSSVVNSTFRSRVGMKKRRLGGGGED